MKTTDVQIGGEYEAWIARENMQVHILAETASGGWTALNLATKKKVHFPLARQLRAEIGTTATTTTDGNLTVVEVPPATVETINGPATKPARKKKAAAEPTAKKVSQIEAALQVLARSKRWQRRQVSLKEEVGDHKCHPPIRNYRMGNGLGDAGLVMRMSSRKAHHGGA